MFEIVAARGKPQRQALALAAEPFAEPTFAAGNAAQNTQLIVLHCRAGINVGAENISLALHTANARLHRAVGLLLMQRVGQALRSERRILSDGPGKLGAIDQRA